MTKFNLIKYLSMPLLMAGIFFGSQNINAQNLSRKDKINYQRGVQAGELLKQKSTSEYDVFGFKFNKHLEKSIKSSKKPKVNLSGKYPVGTFVRFNSDTSGIELQVPKKSINYKISNPIGIVLRNGINVDLCGDQKGNVGNKNTPISSFYFDPHQLYLKKWNVPGSSILDSLILNNVRYVREKVNKIGEKVEGLEEKVASINSTTKENAKKLSYLVKKSGEGSSEKNKNYEESRLNFTLNGSIGGQRYFDGQVQYNIVKGPFNFGPFVSLSEGKTETDVKDEVRFRESTTIGSNTVKERTDVYQVENSKNYVGSLGFKATQNISKGFYGLIEAGWNVMKNKAKEFGTAYITYTRDGKKIQPTNSAPISGTGPDKTTYKFVPMASFGIGEKLSKNISLEEKITHDFQKEGNTSVSLGVKVGF